MSLRTSLIVLVATAFLLFGSVYVVHEGQSAIVLNLGKVVRTDIGPGLHFKVPLIESYRVFDRRLQVLSAEPERFNTKEQLAVSIDFFALGRVQDVSQFYRATGGDEAKAAVRANTDRALPYEARRLGAPCGGVLPAPGDEVVHSLGNSLDGVREGRHGPSLVRDGARRIVAYEAFPRGFHATLRTGAAPAG